MLLKEYDGAWDPLDVIMLAETVEVDPLMTEDEMTLVLELPDTENEKVEAAREKELEAAVEVRLLTRHIEYDIHELRNLLSMVI